MKVIILGSGVIGVSTAYFLAKEGHEVTVIDRQSDAGMETSFANAGEVSPGYSAPWAGPDLPFKALKWLFIKNSPLVIKPSFDWRLWSWSLQLLSNCTSRKYEINKGRMLRLAEYSRNCLRALRQEENIHYDERSKGTLQLFRSRQQLDHAAADMAILDRFNVPYELLDVDGCIRAEPALNKVKEKVAGGLRLPGDETGDCFKYTQAIARLVESKQVKFLFNTRVEKILSSDTKIQSVITDKGELQANAFVIALGSYSPLLLKQIGIQIPVYPVKGYSITIPITDTNGSPESTVMDETYKVAVTRLGDRIRVGGTAELNGYNLKLQDSRRKTLEHVVNDLFPSGGDTNKATFWTGLRPMTPDGTPVIGKTHFSNLFLNTGHGTLGWTMAAGSGKLLADIVSNKPTEIDMSGLTIERYRS